ncbi:MAG: hypothetical protein JXA14_01120 [Anaerolineae bacterium]|jgi:hypothetical protein|nr:hypothetical protein [Anaerolineae bacterium]
MKTRPWLWLSTLVLLLTVLLTFLLQDIARDWVAIPLVRTLRLGNLFLGAVPQIVFWVLLLVIGLLVAARSLMEYKRRPRSVERVPVVYPGRVRTLLRWVQREPESAYFRQRLAHRLTRLATELQAYRQKRAPGRFDRRLDGLDAPPEIRAYLQAGMTLSPLGNLGPISRFTRWLRPRRTASSLGCDLERVVQFLEDQLEVHHGN